MSVGAAPSQVKNYIQAGDPKFESFSRSLRQHMRAASRAATAPALPDPDVTGQISPADVETLWAMANYVGTRWRISEFARLDADSFAQVAQTKAGARPSYLTAYTQAVALFDYLVESLGNADAALDYLFTPSPAEPPADWDVVRFWVIQEFIALYMSVGGAFRAYGWALQPGFSGGPFVPHCPYRTAFDGV